MHLLSINLRDWKAYESAKFEFPAPSKNKNVILIGGRNGFGKTTLFEALALGLFGRDGLRLVLRAGVASDEQGRAQSFKDFIERALYGDALKQGRSSCRIELKFEEESGDPIWIERTWFFNDAGKLKNGAAGEQLRIFQGVARRGLAETSKTQTAGIGIGYRELSFRHPWQGSFCSTVSRPLFTQKGIWAPRFARA